MRDVGQAASGLPSTASQHQAASKFSNVLSDIPDSDVQYGQFRRYIATVSCHTTVKNKQTSATSGILYEVGFRYDHILKVDGAKAPDLDADDFIEAEKGPKYDNLGCKFGPTGSVLAQGVMSPGTSTKGITALRASCVPNIFPKYSTTRGLAPSTTYEVSNTLHSDFHNFAHRHSNFSTDWSHASLCSVVHCIAKGLALASWTDVKASDLSGGVAPRIIALGNIDTPINASRSCVFIPRLVDKEIGSHCFSVLVNAVTGCGSSVATDIVTLDSNTNQPLIDDVPAQMFPRACVQALRVLAANLDASSQTPLFALALFKGFNAVSSLVAHSDEGSILRKIFRNYQFEPPFGGLHYGYSDFSALPALASDSRGAVAVYTDSILMKIAASVAAADPGVVHDDVWYPTIFTAPKNTSVSKDDAKSNVGYYQTMLYEYGPSFGSNFVYCMSKLFDRETQSLTIAKRYVCALFESCHSLTSQKLKVDSMAPWFWVEPTSLVSMQEFGTVAASSSYWSYGTYDSPATFPLFPDSSFLGGDGNISQFNIKMSSARNVPAIFYLSHNRKDGLAHVIPFSADPSQIFHAGKGTNCPENLFERLDSGSPLQEYLWKRGQSPFAAPAELINLEEDWGVTIRHRSVNKETLEIDNNHIFNDSEIESGTATFVVSKPVGMSPGVMNYRHPLVLKNYSRAARSYDAILKGFSEVGSSTFVPRPVSYRSPFSKKRYANKNRGSIIKDDGSSLPAIDKVVRVPTAVLYPPPNTMAKPPPVNTEKAQVTTVLGSVTGPTPPPKNIRAQKASGGPNVEQEHTHPRPDTTASTFEDKPIDTPQDTPAPEGAPSS